MRRLLIYRFACMVTLLAAASSIDASQARAAGEDTQTGGDRCPVAVQEAAHPPVNRTPVLLRVLQPSVEPVPATDGLIHLAYVAQVTNIRRQAAEILDVVAVDPLADFAATGRNIEVDAEGNDVTGKVKRFRPPERTDPEAEPEPKFSTRLPAESGGVMLFDVTYPGLDQIPRLLAHAITVAIPVGQPGVRSLTNPVPVGCVPLAVLHPPLVGHGWTAFNGCCTTAEYHRDAIVADNGDLLTPEHFAIDFLQLGPNNSCCSGPPQALSSWWGYGTPVLAAAHGVVVEVVDGLPDQTTPGTITPLPLANLAGNHVIEDIGGGRYVEYAHLKPGTIPAGVRKGAVLSPGELIGRVGNSGNSDLPHMHFQVMDRPSPFDAQGLPFVFDTQLLEGHAPELQSLGDLQFAKVLSGAPVPIDRTGAGVKRNLMPARNDIFGYNLSR
jgi:hypothetical protein